MNRSYPAAALRANLPSDVGIGENRFADRWNEAVVLWARHRWPHKTAAELAVRARVSVRRAEALLGGHGCMSTATLRNLLHSDEGFEILVVLMADARPRWWRWMLRIMAIAGVRGRQEADRHLLAGLESANDESHTRSRKRLTGAMDAEREISAAISRAEGALRLSDPPLPLPPPPPPPPPRPPPRDQPRLPPPQSPR